MKVVSACPLPVGSLVWRAWSGAVVLSVVCKATFQLRSSESPLAEQQDPIFDADRYWNDDPREALCVASDLVPFKRKAEVLVVGHAYAPSGDPVRSLHARLTVAGVNKSIEIFGDRVYTHEGRLRDGTRFAKAPLLWKYAAGGPDTPNPVGIRHDAPWDVYGQRLLPRIQPPGLHVTGPEFIPAIGFGPLAPTWPERLQKLNTHAYTWDHAGWVQRPLPQGIDAAYFNAAPADQHADAIRADERLVIENLHPVLPRIATNLSPVIPEAVVERPGRPAEAVPFLCDTMWIDSDRGICSLTWRARIILAAADEAGRVVVTASGAPVPDAVTMGPQAAPNPTAPSAPVTSGPSVAASSAPPPAVAASVPPPAAPPPAASSPAQPADPFPIERCAVIAASCARRPAERLAILEANHLTEDDWDELEHRWMSALRKDAQGGREDRVVAYDRAYVLRLEEERGPITVEEYARLALAHERDRAALTRALRDLELPWGCTPRILRTYAERMHADPALAERVRAVMAEK